MCGWPRWAGPGKRWTGGEKKSVHAAEHDTQRVRSLRAAFVEAEQAKDFTRFKFVNETSTNLPYCCCYARAEGGQRAHQATPLHGGPTVTLVAALTPNGLQAAMNVSGAVNEDVLALTWTRCSAPRWCPAT